MQKAILLGQETQTGRNTFRPLVSKLVKQNDKKRVPDGKRDSRGYMEAAVIDPPGQP